MRHSKFLSVVNHRAAMIAAYALCAVLFICANTNSCCMVHQPEMPEGLRDFSKIQ